jgi:hypothetical protein
VAVIRNTKSGKAVLFVDERGFTYIISKTQLMKFLNTKDTSPLMLSLLPTRNNSERFGNSMIWVDNKKLSVKDAFKEGMVDCSFWLSLDGFESGGFGVKDSKSKSKKVFKPITDVKL